MRSTLRGHAPAQGRTRRARGAGAATVRDDKEFPAYARKDLRMGLRDTWHRTLVYFGLAEEEDPRYEAVPEPEPEAELEDRYRERPNVRRLQRRRRDEIDEIFADDSRTSARETRPLRPVGGNGRTTEAGEIQVHLVIPKNFNDAQQIADQFKDAIPVILNLQGTDTDLSKRLIDFSSGLTYALDGGMQRIADKVFLLTPRNVEVSAEERARLIEKGFFNQS
jgi:cell division inhibitor SepF